MYKIKLYVSGRSSGNYQIHTWSYRFLPKEERPSKKQKTSHDSGSEDSQDYRYLTKSGSRGRGSSYYWYYIEVTVEEEINIKVTETRIFIFIMNFEISKKWVNPYTCTWWISLIYPTHLFLKVNLKWNVVNIFIIS